MFFFYVIINVYLAPRPLRTCAIFIIANNKNGRSNMQNALALQALLKNGFLVAINAMPNPKVSNADSIKTTTAAIAKTFVIFSI